MSADARSYLAQQLNRFRLAAKDMRAQLEQIDLKVKEVQTDLMCLMAAVDQLEEDMAMRASKPKDAAA